MVIEKIGILDEIIPILGTVNSKMVIGVVSKSLNDSIVVIDDYKNVESYEDVGIFVLASDLGVCINQVKTFERVYEITLVYGTVFLVVNNL